MVADELYGKTQEAMNKAFEGEVAFTKKDGATIINAIAEMIAANIIEGEEVPIPGIGKFSTNERQCRNVQNPTEMITARCLKFKASPTLKSLIKGKK